MLSRDPTVLGTRNSVAAKASRIKPFADRSWCNFADLSYLSSSEDRLHRGLQFHFAMQEFGLTRISAPPYDGWLS